MRTTIRMDDELYREVKTQAARSGRTVASVLEDAVRAGLNVPGRRKAEPFAVRPLGFGGLRPGVDLASNRSVREAMDEGLPLDALR
ncbi:MAG: ribbon-helix-helix protein, CopG family [Thermocrispum sp.]